MTEARHDQAVALLTGTSPTIALLVERDPNAPRSPGQSRQRAHSPPPPEPSDSPDQDEEGLQGNHLGRMEDEYPIEVIRGGAIWKVVEIPIRQLIGFSIWLRHDTCCCPVRKRMVHGMKTNRRMDCGVNQWFPTRFSQFCVIGPKIIECIFCSTMWSDGRKN